MIKVEYTTTLTAKQRVIASLKVEGHALGSTQNLLSLRVCAGVSAILLGSENCFEKDTKIETHKGFYYVIVESSRDILVLEVIVLQLLKLYNYYPVMFDYFKEVNE